jgi:hypothetical protein
MSTTARPVTLARIRRAYGALASLPRRCGRWMLGPPEDCVEIACNGPHGRYSYEGPLALEGRALPIADLEQVIAREHGDRFAIVIVRWVQQAAARTLVADVTLVFGVPWTLAERGSVRVLGHAGFELPLVADSLAELRSHATVVHLRAALRRAANALRCGALMARRLDDELRRDGRAIPAQLREVSALLRAHRGHDEATYCTSFDSSRM